VIEGGYVLQSSIDEVEDSVQESTIGIAVGELPANNRNASDER
jgi:hypothetical protein